MARVDPGDDAIERWVAFHFRYDPDRRERRNVIVGAFDGEHEYRAFLAATAAALRQAIGRGDAESVESVSGTRWPIGYHAATAAARMHPKFKPHK